MPSAGVPPLAGVEASGDPADVGPEPAAGEGPAALVPAGDGDGDDVAGEGDPPEAGDGEGEEDPVGGAPEAGEGEPGGGAGRFLTARTTTSNF